MNARVSPAQPRIVCLCGSTRFRKEFEEANKRETLAGRIVLSVGMFGHHEGLDMNGPIKAMLDELHLAKIRLADEVYIINVEGYIGDSTRRELLYAQNLGKAIRSLIPIPGLPIVACHPGNSDSNRTA